MGDELLKRQKQQHSATSFILHESIWIHYVCWSICSSLMHSKCCCERTCWVAGVKEGTLWLISFHSSLIISSWGPRQYIYSHDTFIIVKTALWHIQCYEKDKEIWPNICNYSTLKQRQFTSLMTLIITHRFSKVSMMLPAGIKQETAGTVINGRAAYLNSRKHDHTLPACFWDADAVMGSLRRMSINVLVCHTHPRPKMKSFWDFVSA